MLRNMSIRRSRPDDAESFCRCLDVVARERRWLAVVEGPSLPSVQSFLQDVHKGGGSQFFAFEPPALGTDVVGWCDAVKSKLPGFEHSARLGMGLLPEYRGHGLGERLLVAVMEDCQKQGVERIELEVFESNPHAIRLYKRHKFLTEGIKRGGRKLDGTVEDVVCMAWTHGSG